MSLVNLIMESNNIRETIAQLAEAGTASDGAQKRKKVKKSAKNVAQGKKSALAKSSATQAKAQKGREKWLKSPEGKAFMKSLGKLNAKNR